LPFCLPDVLLHTHPPHNPNTLADIPTAVSHLGKIFLSFTKEEFVTAVKQPKDIIPSHTGFSMMKWITIGDGFPADIDAEIYSLPKLTEKYVSKK